jgi:glutamine amidotransferase
MIAIIDYGMGNIHSVNKALQFFGAKTIITNKPEDIQSAEKAVLPGVGAFDDAILELKQQGLINTIKEYLLSRRPFLGICLGMQLLFEESQEGAKTKGLGILKGKVKRFEEKKGIKIPHMGWNQLKNVKNKCPLLNNIPDDPYVYFCHSYYPQAKDKNVIAATTDYGLEFTSIVWQDNIYGVQFHPEKSQKTGLKMIDNFVNLC